MDSCRLTSKYVKFVTPAILEKYDILIWCDNKCLSKLNNILSLIDTFKKSNYQLIHFLHQERITIQQELEYTLSLGLENTNGITFLNELNHCDIPLTDTCFVVRN
jgi:hypothetical protein